MVSATITIIAQGGTQPLSYTFHGETNSTGIFTHEAGIDFECVTDANNCNAATGTFTVVEPVITVKSITQTAITCYDGLQQLTITAEGGTMPLSYTFHGETNNTGILHTGGNRF
jgi:hypothetical protein